jgi:hypothetical protein
MAVHVLRNRWKAAEPGGAQNHDHLKPSRSVGRITFPTQLVSFRMVALAPLGGSIQRGEFLGGMFERPDEGSEMKIVRPLEPGAPAPGHDPDACGVAAGWVALGLSRAECLGIRVGNLQDWLTHAEAVDSWAELSGPGVDAIAILSPSVAALFPGSAANLFADAARNDSWLMVLLPWQEPPTRSIRADGLAESFCCSAKVFSHLLKTAREDKVERLCFRLLDATLNGKVQVQSLLVRQLPLVDHATAFPSVLEQSAAMIMAHRGPKRFLTAALRSIRCSAGASQVTVRVGLDVEDVSDYRNVIEAFPDVEFYRVDGAPVGPYVIRQNLIDRSSEHLIIFHDSDDFSCSDRIARQAAEISEWQVEVVGSHELRVDELAGSVEVYRFPLDASAALALPGSTERNDRANEPLLHPTLTMVRSGFVQAGGFSTNRKIANDTQFMLRAYFSMRMKNVDGFLYIRRRHPGALTVAKETALGTPLRHFLGTTWGADFEAVKSGKARLEETSLWPRLGPVPPRLTRLWAPGADLLRRRA